VSLAHQLPWWQMGIWIDHGLSLTDSTESEMLLIEARNGMGKKG